MPESHPDHPHGPHPDRLRADLAELGDLLAIGFQVDGPVLQIAASTWVIYGHCSYDVGVIVGEYPDADRAAAVLNAASRLDRNRLDRP